MGPRPYPSYGIAQINITDSSHQNNRPQVRLTYGPVQEMYGNDQSEMDNGINEYDLVYTTQTVNIASNHSKSGGMGSVGNTNPAIVGVVASVRNHEEPHRHGSSHNYELQNYQGDPTSIAEIQPISNNFLHVMPND